MRSVALSLVVVGMVGPGCVQDDPDDLAPTTTAAESRRLRYRPVDLTAAPPGLDFWSPVGLTDDGAVYGQGFDCDDTGVVCTLSLVERSRHGQFRVVRRDFQVTDVDGDGDVGGCTIDDPTTFFGRAAVVRPNGALRLIAPRPGEVTACVTRLADDRVAAVASFDADFNLTSYVLDRHLVRTIPVDGTVEDINRRGQVAGITFTPEGSRAYRFDVATGATTILDPIAGDPDSWAQGINEDGEVLGYSFIGGGTERIGHWTRNGQFRVSFVEGTPEFPTVSNRLVWNEDGLIVISRSNNDPNTYLVPAPGVRLNLADLVGGAEVPTTLYALALNDRGDLLATSFDDGRTFLYLRD